MNFRPTYYNVGYSQWEIGVNEIFYFKIIIYIRNLQKRDFLEVLRAFKIIILLIFWINISEPSHLLPFDDVGPYKVGFIQLSHL